MMGMPVKENITKEWVSPLEEMFTGMHDIFVMKKKLICMETQDF